MDVVGMNVMRVVSSASACVPSLYLRRISSDNKLHLQNKPAATLSLQHNKYVMSQHK